MNTLRGRALALRAGLLAVLLFSLVGVTSAYAKEPTGEFKVFNQCPRFTSGVFDCLYSQTESGQVTIGSTEVPITKTIVLQGGIVHHEGKESFVGALNGETLSKAPQKVPGGLLDLIKCNEIKGEGLIEKAARLACEWTFENSVTGVNATTELAKPASEIGINGNNLLNEEGVALTLPLKVKLENTFLGGECYIGSSSSPVTLKLTDGATSPPAPNKSIHGKTGSLVFHEEFNIAELTGNTLVDNAFSAPEATGCGGIFSFLIDPLVDSKLGLPSAAGHNTAIQNNRIREGFAEAVIASEK